MNANVQPGISLSALLAACADDALDDGIRIDTELVPLGGVGAPVKPAVYASGMFQHDRRWESPRHEEPAEVIVIDNVPSQANRLEEALRLHRSALSLPEFLLDFDGLPLPSHLPTRLSSLQFPHRNADAYLRDAMLGNEDFIKSELGQAIFAATAQTCGPLVAWFPQSLLYGFWQSHLGKKRHNAKHARAWVSEIVGWRPAATETRVQGLKGDPLNLTVDEAVTSNPDDRSVWNLGKNGDVPGGKAERLAGIGHGRVPVSGDAAPGAVSFARVTQRAMLSLAQLRRVRLGNGAGDAADAALRALLVALGLHAHQLAFGHGFALRSGAELRPGATEAIWLGPDGDVPCALGDPDATSALLQEAEEHAKDAGVPLDGWGRGPVTLTPNAALSEAIRRSWPAP